MPPADLTDPWLILVSAGGRVRRTLPDGTRVTVHNPGPEAIGLRMKRAPRTTLVRAGLVPEVRRLWRAGRSWADRKRV